MAILSAAIFAGLLAGAADAKVFDRVPGPVPSNWRLARAPEPGQPIKLRVALRSENPGQFEQKLLQVSDPAHAHYGKHLQGHEVKALLAPPAAASTSVVDWLEAAGVRDIDNEGDWIHFRTNVTTANSLLETEFGWFHNEDTGREFLRTTHYGVPGDIAEHINLVQPTTRFGNIKAMRSTILDSTPLQEVGDVAAPLGNINLASAPGDIPASCNTTITPTCLLKLYNVHYGADPKTKNKVAFASFLEEYARYADLAAWEPQFAPWAVGQNFTTVTFNGGLDDQTSPADSGEANLDAQTIKGVSAPIPEIQYSTGGRGPLVPDLDQPDPATGANEPYLEYLIGLSKLPNDKLPQTISHSYGEDEQSVPESYNRQVCQMFGELGARGVTILFSSGDSGVGSACQSNDGKNTTEFQPQFPASCPWVLSVGGTQFIEPEQAVFFSSGGFSRIYPTPAYQQAAVANYLPQADKRFSKYYNARGRGFPDVAAQSVRYAIQDKGVLKRYQGTSCASPAFAGVIALLNSARIASGLPSFGFINPWLYSVGVAGGGFNDITKGHSTGCNGRARFNGPPNGSPVIPDARFDAVKGWDPVTGLGTPNFGNLLRLSTPWVPNKGGPVP